MSVLWNSFENLLDANWYGSANVFQAYRPKKNRIHYSGPLMPPGGNLDDMLREHERQIQQAVRKARLDKTRSGKNFQWRRILGSYITLSYFCSQALKSHRSRSSLLVKRSLSLTLQDTARKVNASSLTWVFILNNFDGVDWETIDADRFNIQRPFL